ERLLELRRRREQIRQQPDDAQLLGLVARVLHHRAHATVVPFVVPLDLLQRVQPRALVRQLLAQADHLNLVLGERLARPLERALFGAAALRQLLRGLLALAQPLAHLGAALLDRRLLAEQRLELTLNPRAPLLRLGLALLERREP